MGESVPVAPVEFAQPARRGGEGRKLAIVMENWGTGVSPCLLRQKARTETNLGNAVATEFLKVVKFVKFVEFSAAFDSAMVANHRYTWRRAFSLISGKFRLGDILQYKNMAWQIILKNTVPTCIRHSGTFFVSLPQPCAHGAAPLHSQVATPLHLAPQH